MTIVKAPLAGGIARFRTAPVLIVEEVAPPPSDPRIALLTEEVAALEAELATVRRDALAAVEAAREEGAHDVRLDDRERLDAVVAGVRALQETWRERLDAMEQLAVDVARAAVARMFGDHRDLSDLVTRTAAAYFRRMGEEAIVALRVSPLDFPDSARLSDAARSIGLAADLLSADPMLGAGACRADLRLGQAVLDPVLQWAEIERLLDGAGPAAGPC